MNRAIEVSLLIDEYQQLVQELEYQVKHDLLTLDEMRTAFGHCEQIEYLFNCVLLKEIGDIL